MEIIFNLLKGMAIGVANIIPGVSGGTIALILGIYSKLTEAVGEFLTNKEKRFSYFKFLFQIGLGAGLGIVLFAKVVKYLYDVYPQSTNFFFLGLIVASVPLIIKTGNNMKISVKKSVFFGLGFFIVLFFIIINKNMDHSIINKGLDLNINMFYLGKLFICGAIAAGAMIIPGISGSFLLILLGEYYNILEFINNGKIIPLVIMGIGMIFGIFIFSKLIDFLLKKYTGITFYFILGLVLASIIEIWPGFDKNIMIYNLLSFTVGVLGSYFLSLHKK